MRLHGLFKVAPSSSNSGKFSILGMNGNYQTCMYKLSTASRSIYNVPSLGGCGKITILFSLVPFVDSLNGNADSVRSYESMGTLERCHWFSASKFFNTLDYSRNLYVQ